MPRLLRSLLDNLALDRAERLATEPTLVAIESIVRDVAEENEKALGERVQLEGRATGWGTRMHCSA